MPLADANLILRPTTATAIDSADLHILSDAIELEGTPLEGLALRVTASSGTGTSPHLTIELYGTTTTTAPTTTSTCLAIRTGLELAAGGTTAPYARYIIPFCDPQVRSLKVLVELTGTTATAALTLASCEVAIIKNVGRDWSREVNFH